MPSRMSGLLGQATGAAMTVQTGVIKVWRDDRGYEFIARDDGERDLFCHFSDCIDGFRPTAGSRVAFEVVPDEDSRGYRGRADNVRPA